MNFKTKQILKYLVNNMDRDITFDMLKENFNLSHMDLVKLTRPLYNKDVIVVTDEDKIYATKYSKYYLDNLKRQSIKNFLNKIIWSFFIPVIVSIITTLTTLWLTGLFEVE